MTSVDFKLLPLLAVVLLSGCSLQSMLTSVTEQEPQAVVPEAVSSEQSASCPSCSVEKPVLPPVGDCAKAVAVVNYADSCQACGRFPVTVRAHREDESCK